MYVHFDVAASILNIVTFSTSLIGHYEEHYTAANPFIMEALLHFLKNCLAVRFLRSVQLE